MWRWQEPWENKLGELRKSMKGFGLYPAVSCSFVPGGVKGWDTKLQLAIQHGNPWMFGSSCELASSLVIREFLTIPTQIASSLYFGKICHVPWVTEWCSRVPLDSFSASCTPKLRGLTQLYLTGVWVHYRLADLGWFQKISGGFANTSAGQLEPYATWTCIGPLNWEALPHVSLLFSLGPAFAWAFPSQE